MCGIVGYIGNNGKKSDLIAGLKALEYRGYDSAGIVYDENNELKIDKAVGKIKALEELILDNNITIGLGHTRWATHGKPTENNAHPHRHNKIIIVHNGIIENYATLKDELITKGYQFYSDTDTEVGAAYIDYVYQQLKDPISTLNKCQQVFKGSYALAIIFDDLNHLYAMRHNCPLIIGVSDEGNMIASDMIAIKHKTDKYILLDNLNIAKLSKNQIDIYQNMEIIDYEIKTMDLTDDAITKAGYDHYMLKEINEIPQIIETSVLEAITLPLDIFKYKRIDIVACGSAYYAGLVGKYLLEEHIDIEVNCYLASEYRYQKNWWHPKKLVIVISQSGETADTLAALELANKHVDTLAIVNSPNSSIARESKYVMLTKAGYEIAVATTKAYVAQVLIFVRMLKWSHIVVDTVELKNVVQKVINYDDYQNIAKLLEPKEHIFFIGRKIDYALALEGSLKLKEISYIHSETYAAGELKHGTISLIEEGTPVIAVITDLSIADKTISNIKEVKARGAYVIAVVNDQVEISEDAYDKLLVIPYLNGVCNPIITIIALQLIAYYTAKLKGCDIDQPRNLAKSVTVE